MYCRSRSTAFGVTTGRWVGRAGPVIVLRFEAKPWRQQSKEETEAHKPVGPAKAAGRKPAESPKAATTPKAKVSPKAAEVRKPAESPKARTPKAKESPKAAAAPTRAFLTSSKHAVRVCKSRFGVWSRGDP